MKHTALLPLLLLTLAACTGQNTNNDDAQDSTAMTVSEADTMAMMSESEEDLRDAIAEANAELPVDFAGIGELAHMKYNGHDVVYEIHLDESLVSLDMLEANRAQAEATIGDMVKQMCEEPSVRTMCQGAADCGASLNFVFTGDDDSQEVRFSVSNDQLKQVLSR